jgi:cytidyltransferase-like protein
MIRVLVFGTFDGVHEGHRAMLREAKALGDYLAVAVAPDNVVTEIKGKICVNRSAQRIQGVRDEHIADEVVLGDKLLSNWSVLKKYRPDIIALGYDQDELKEALDTHFENSEKSLNWLC